MLQNQWGEMSLYMYSLCIAFATSLRKIYILESFSFILSKTAKKYQERICNILKDKQLKNICLAANSKSIVNCRKL